MLFSNVLSEKTTKYKGKVRRKSAKKAISGIFPAFTAGKKILTKIGLGHVMSIANMHLYAKKLEKTNDEISRNGQKISFSGIFPAFSAGRIRFLKIGLSHILNIGILHQCAKFHEKIYSTAREIQEIPFFRRKSAFPAIFIKFRLQKSV